MKSKLKVMTVVGTRPEIIRLSRVMALLDSHLSHVLVHTGQNYDYELNEIFFEDLQLRTPDYVLGVNTSSLGNVLGETLIKIEAVINTEKPDAMLILGDTNAAIAGIIAKRMRIPIFHMEAGNRSYDFNVPEEINRRLIDHIADFNLVYTEHARRHLLSEGLPHRRIYLTGSPMKEVLECYRDKIERSPILSLLSLQDKGYFLISVHREENVDHPSNLQKIVHVLNRLTTEWGLPVIVSTHPRTRNRLESLQDTPIDDRVRFLKPFGFSDYNHLQLHAACTISDSGTISEESSIMGFPAVTIRQSLERPEAMDTGSIILTGFDPEIVLDSVRLTMSEQEDRPFKSLPTDYNINDVSWRVLKLILGTTKLSNYWDNIAKKS